jgi:hypothetical protein
MAIHQELVESAQKPVRGQSGLLPTGMRQPAQNVGRHEACGGVALQCADCESRHRGIKGRTQAARAEDRDRTVALSPISEHRPARSGLTTPGDCRVVPPSKARWQKAARASHRTAFGRAAGCTARFRSANAGQVETLWLTKG